MKTAVIGSGAWGTTLAKVLAENGHQVNLWCHDKKIADEVNQSRENKVLLPDVVLPEDITAVWDLALACHKAELVVVVVASAFYDRVAQQLKGVLSEKALIVSATKGINEKDNQQLSQVLKTHLPLQYHKKIAVLSGPNIAREIALQKVSTTVISSSDEETAKAVQKAFNCHYLRVYTNSDMIGTEWGGTLKNVIALAGGIADGLELGDNAKSAIMVRGLVEISRFACHFGAKPETFYGLAGLGDLITTCSSTLSRNHHVGEQLGRGKSLSEILGKMVAVAEGVSTAKLVYQLALKHEIQMPVTEQVYKVLFEEKPVAEAIQNLMHRELRAEH